MAHLQPWNPMRLCFSFHLKENILKPRFILVYIYNYFNITIVWTEISNTRCQLAITAL